MPPEPDSELTARVRTIKLLLLDVDGVLTDGRLYFANSGEEMKAFHILDGHGIKQLQRSGVKVGIVTGRRSKLVERRARELEIEILVQNSPDKLQSVREVAQQQGLELRRVAFMGDDHPDLPAIRAVGLGLCVANAHPDVAEHCHWQSRTAGGEGAVREACDMIMRARDSYRPALQKYL